MISSKQIIYESKKIAGYLLGFILFYAPFALFQQAIGFILDYKNYAPVIHNFCVRIPVEHFFSGKFFAMTGPAFIGTILLLTAALFWGPLFCGFLCPAGAVPEYLSKIIPARFKVDWTHHFSPTVLRYGFLFGFLLAPFTNGLLACAYCNFYVFDLLVNFVARGYIVAFSSTLLLTMFFWLVVFGLFTEGGRGFCLFFCPVGSVQNFMHYLGSKLPFSWQLKIDETKCFQCTRCADNCPMRALTKNDGKIEHNRHICILCLRCKNTCAYKNITYSRQWKGERL